MSIEVTKVWFDGEKLMAEPKAEFMHPEMRVFWEKHFDAMFKLTASHMQRESEREWVALTRWQEDFCVASSSNALEAVITAGGKLRELNT